MSTRRGAASSLLAAWPFLGTVYRLAWMVEEIMPQAKRGLRLVRAEARLARESVPVSVYAALVALVGFWILLAGLVAGSVVALHEAGWPLPSAIGLPTGVGTVVLAAGAWVLWRGIERLTFVETRARMRALLETLDDDD